MPWPRPWRALLARPRARTLTLALALPLLLAVAPLPAQTLDDSLTMPRGQLCTGFVYTHDGWDRYWEGTLKRANGNIGTITTQSVTWMGTFGVTDRLNVIAMVPWVTTKASQGVLAGMDGLQDGTLGLKWTALETDLTRRGTLRAFLAASGSVPLSDYTPDFQPLSIGLASRRASGRLTLNFQAKEGWFVEGTGAYTFRDDVKLDRPTYYTDGQLFFSDQVAMPDTVDYAFRAGYWKHGLYVPISYSEEVTLGGGDIRRQDTPFVSNRMNSSRVDATAMYFLQKPKNLVVRLEASHTISGRNVGQSTTLSAGLFYTVKF
jgi:hypothetical protein